MAACFIMTILLVRAFTLPEKGIAVVMAVFYSIIVVTLILKFSMGKYALPFFSLICVVDFVIARIPRHWLILTVTGLLLSYELLEFSFFHDVDTGNVELHQGLIRRHVVYLAVVFTLITGLSFGVLFLFERITVQFSENIYINALIFSVVFFAVLYVLRYSLK